jgi:hypothetical protein
METDRSGRASPCSTAGPTHPVQSTTARLLRQPGQFGRGVKPETPLNPQSQARNHLAPTAFRMHPLTNANGEGSSQRGPARWTNSFGKLSRSRLFT